MREDLLGWKGVTIVLEEATGEQADHFKERANIHFSFRTLVTKGKSEGVRIFKGRSNGTSGERDN